MEDESVKIREELEKRDKEVYQKSEYSKKGAFYISWSKWKRLRFRCCRVKTIIHLMGKTGEHYELKLDSAQHPIGLNRKSLDNYVSKYFLRKPYVLYWVAKWNIQPY